MRTAIDKRITEKLEASYEEGSSDVTETAKAQLGEYFAGKRDTFDLPLRFAGTEFQKQVWHALLAVEYGQTSTYLELAESLQNAKAVRAVASANGANALSIFVPCHRIIGSKGELVGYAGGLPAKKKLLELEQAPSPQLQLTL